MTRELSMPSSLSPWVHHHRGEATPLTVGVPPSASVVVIGSGICGLVTAAMLADHGVDVVVIDARSRTDSVTARSSAKVSVLHDLTAAKIARIRSAHIAATYIGANQFGFEWIERYVNERSIDCAWERRDAIEYITHASTRPTLQREVQLYQRADIAAESTTAVGLPYPVIDAVRVREQAQFDPLAFLDGIVHELRETDNQVIDGVRATGVDSSRNGGVVVQTSAGNIDADHVVVATGLPFLDRGTHFARSEPASSYVIACEVETMPEAGMFLAVDGEKRSLRSATTSDGIEVLLVGGEGHKTGQGGDTEQRYRTLAAWANSNFGVRQITHRFMAQDFTTPDHIPYVGAIAPGNDRIHVATGMNKWGFTNAPAAAAINVARIVDGAAPQWTSAYSSTRLPVGAIPDLVAANTNVAKHMIGGWVSALRRRSTPQPGHGHVSIHGRRPIAISSSRCDAATTSVQGTCPHLGAALAWNPAEQTWDCPLHGSRFEANGRLLHGPATSDLTPRPAATDEA